MHFWRILHSWWRRDGVAGGLRGPQVSRGPPSQWPTLDVLRLLGVVLMMIIAKRSPASAALSFSVRRSCEWLVKRCVLTYDMCRDINIAGYKYLHVRRRMMGSVGWPLGQSAVRLVVVRWASQ